MSTTRMDWWSAAETLAWIASRDAEYVTKFSDEALSSPISVELEDGRVGKEQRSVGIKVVLLRYIETHCDADAPGLLDIERELSSRCSQGKVRVLGLLHRQGNLATPSPEFWIDAHLYEDCGELWAGPDDLFTRANASAWYRLKFAVNDVLREWPGQSSGPKKRRSGPRTPYEAPLKALLQQIKQRLPDLYASSPDQIGKELDRLWKQQARPGKLPSSRSARNDAIRRMRQQIEDEV